MDFNLALKKEYPVLDIEYAKKTFQPYIEKIDEVYAEAESLEVVTDEANQKAVEIGTSAKKLKKQIDQLRKQIIDQPDSFVKSVNSFTKIFTDRLESIEQILKQKINQYRIFQEQKRREQEKAAKEAIEEAQRRLEQEAEEKGIEPVRLEAPIILPPAKIIRSENGIAYSRKHWTFRIVDINLVPREYMIVSDNKVRAAIKAGIREIPGLEIYEEDITTFRV